MMNAIINPEIIFPIYAPNAAPNRKTRIKKKTNNITVFQLFALISE
jgi:hypothetical protein